MVYILYILLSPICLGYVEDIFQTFLNASKELVNAATELKDKTPAPMNVMVEKQSSGSTEKEGSQEQDGRAKCPSNHIRCCVILFKIFGNTLEIQLLITLFNSIVPQVTIKKS